MLLSSRSPITRLLTVLCYAAAAGAGQGLHLLAGHDHDHRAAEQAVDVGHRQFSHTAAPSAVIDDAAAEEHDADQCPICQYHSLGQWQESSESAATSATVEQFSGSHFDLFRRVLPVRALGPRRPPSFSATLA